MLFDHDVLVAARSQPEHVWHKKASEQDIERSVNRQVGGVVGVLQRNAQVQRIGIETKTGESECGVR